MALKSENDTACCFCVTKRVTFSQSFPLFSIDDYCEKCNRHQLKIDGPLMEIDRELNVHRWKSTIGQLG